MKPVLIYDEDCHFCKRWIARWHDATGDKVEYLPSQAAADRFPDITSGEFAKAVQWIDADNRRESGAAAVLAALATSSATGRLILSFYRLIPGFSKISEGAYRFVAQRRGWASLFTRLLWGEDVRRPTYGISSRIFLHLLGAIYLIALLSYWRQLPGLNGTQGIAPAEMFFPQVREILGPEGFWQFPSLCWWAYSDAALHVFCALGILAALLLTLGMTPLPCLIILWAIYLSLSVAGQVFYQFQWDILLIESGFLAIFLAPGVWRLRGALPPSRAAHFLLIWLLFRLMFSSGVVKLTSGDPAWANATALDFHYFTQPLPTPVAWYAQQLPGWWQWLCVKVMFFIELFLPFLLFAPRRLRLAAVFGIILLQAAIALTGNYGIFNFLTLSLCLLAVDDVVWIRGRDEIHAPKKTFLLSGPLMTTVATGIVLLSLPPLLGTFRKPFPWLAPLTAAHSVVAPFRTINSYGLFAVMTTSRREIIIQGSDDGMRWETYSFRYKPGSANKAPPWVAPYMPRLDWQMWFAALGDMENNLWLQNFLIRLLQGSPSVISLLEANPFPEKPPRFVRAITDSYTFTTAPEREATGRWWNVDPLAIYCPDMSLPHR